MYAVPCQRTVEVLLRMLLVTEEHGKTFLSHKAHMLVIQGMLNMASDQPLTSHALQVGLFSGKARSHPFLNLLPVT